MKIFGKIMLLVGGSIVCLVVAFCLVGYFILTDFGDSAAQEQLQIASKAVQKDVDENLEVQRLISDMVASNDTLAAAVAAKDTAKLKSIAKTLVDSPVIDMVTICDTEGRVLARGHSDKAGDVLGQNRLSVWQPLTRGTPVIGIEPGNEVKLTLASGTPIKSGGKLVGVAVTGVDFSSGVFVNSIKQNFGVECTIFLDDIRVSTSILRDGKPVTGTPLNNAAIYDNVVRKGNSTTARNVIAGQPYDTIYWPWKDLSGKNAGIFFVGLSRASIVDTQQRVVLTFIVAGAILAVLLMGAGAVVARAIARPLKAATVYAEAVAGGDFNATITHSSKDEVGSLVIALRSMVENLKEKIAEAEGKSREAEQQATKASEAMSEAKKAQETAEAGQKAILVAAENVEAVVARLSAATEQLSAQVETSSKSAVGQREQVTASATAMEEMTATVLEVARNAGVASEASERARLKARDGEGIVGKSVEAIKTVQDDTLSLKKNMEDLGAQAESIGVVMTVISDIADQTNLLALNAAIEAARAGEAGRGFAVVADEVRKLAEKTMSATQEVGNAIKGIQQGTKRSIEAVERTTNNLETATEMVHQSGASLTEIVQESVYTADQVRSIATAAEEQSAASEEIAHSLEGINQSAVENAVIMQQSAEAVAELARQAHQLQTLVNELRKS